MSTPGLVPRLLAVGCGLNAAWHPVVGWPVSLPFLLPLGGVVAGEGSVGGGPEGNDGIVVFCQGLLCSASLIV